MSEPNPYAYAPRPNTAAKAVTQRIAVSAVNLATLLAPNLSRTGRVRIKAVGADVDFTVNEVAGVLAKDALGSGTTVGYTLQAGQSEVFFIALAGAVGFVTAIASGAGFLVITRAGSDRADY